MASLAPGASDATTFTGVHTITQAEIDAGTFTNTATTTGTPPTGTDVVDTDTDTQNFTPTPGIELVKSGTIDDGANNVVDEGDVINYAFTVTNTGNVTLSNITLSDPDATISGGPIASLAPSASDATTFTGVHTITQAEIDAGTFTNTATTTGTPPTGSNVVDTDTDTQNFTPIPSLTIVKTQTSGPSPVSVKGDVIGYTIVVINDGNQSLTNVIVGDLLPDGTTGTLAGPIESGTADGILSVNETFTYTISYTVTQADIEAGSSLVNTASVVTTELPIPEKDKATTPYAPPIPISNWAIIFGVFLIGASIAYRFRRRLA